MAERAIRIEADGVRLYAILADTPTAVAVWEALPLEGKARVLPQEIAIDPGRRLATAPGARAESARAGDLAYHPGPPAIALVFAAAPPDAPAADPEVVVFGRITGDASRLHRVREGARVRLTALEG